MTTEDAAKVGTLGGLAAKRGGEVVEEWHTGMRISWPRASERLYQMWLGYEGVVVEVVETNIGAESYPLRPYTHRTEEDESRPRGKAEGPAPLPRVNDVLTR